MVALVSQTEALLQLRLTGTALSADELQDVDFKALQASAIVVDYLKHDGPVVWPPTDPPTPDGPPWTDATAPPLVKAAVLIILTALYDGRTPGDELLSQAIKDILWRSRDPALA